MQNPEPPVGWTPTGSTVLSGLGGAIAVVLIAAYDKLTNTTIDPVTSSAITLICCSLINYIHPDGGRK